VKQQEGDIDLHALAIICVRSVDDAVFARQLFLLSVIILSACAKDETADMNGEPLDVPQETTPAVAPEWYPTPKRTGPPGFRVMPPADRRDPQRQDPQQARPSPGTGSPPNDGRYDLENIQWPSDKQAKEFSPWTTEQTPTQPQAGPPSWAQRRPWGAIEQGPYGVQPPQPQQDWGVQGGQPDWGMGYGLEAVQPAYPPGTYGQNPQAYPGYVW
jgi:hypothetical protein